MSLEPLRSVHIKKLTLNNDGPLSSKSHYSPQASVRNRIQQARAYGFQSNDLSINNNNQKTFSFVLNGSTVKFDQTKTPKSGRIASFGSTTKEKGIKTPITLSEIYATPISSFRESMSHRLMKSQTQIPNPSPGLKSYSPDAKNLEGGISTSLSVKMIKPSELTSVLQAKTEELNKLRSNIQDLQVRVQSLAVLKQDQASDSKDVEEIQKNLSQKDQIIEIYEKLLTLCCPNKVPDTLKLFTTDMGEDTQKHVTSTSPISIKVSSRLKPVSLIDTQSNNCSIASMVPRSMNLTSSPTPAEKNNSRWPSRVGDQDCHGDKEEVSVPTYRLISKGTSNIIHKVKVKNDEGFKLRVVDTKSKAEAKLFREKHDLMLKSGIRKSLSPSLELEGVDTRNQNSDYTKLIGTEENCSPTSSVGNILLRKNSDVPFMKDLGSLIERFSIVFKNLEENRRIMEEKNEYIRRKLDELALNKQQKEKVV